MAYCRLHAYPELFKARLAQYEQANQLTLETISRQTNWVAAPMVAYRKPNPMEIFSNGINSDIGRFSEITLMRSVRLVRSEFSDDPMLAVFQFLDPTFVVLIVFSLLAILFTYNTINGEKLAGTDTGLKRRYEDAMKSYRDQYTQSCRFISLQFPPYLGTFVSQCPDTADIPLFICHKVTKTPRRIFCFCPILENFVPSCYGGPAFWIPRL